MAINWDKVISDAQKKDEKANKKSPSGYVGDKSATEYKLNKTKDTLRTAVENTKTKNEKANSGGKNKASGASSLPTNSKRQGKSTLGTSGYNAYEKSQAEYAVPTVLRNASEAYINNTGVGTLYMMATGEGLLDDKAKQNPYYDELHRVNSDKMINAASVGQAIGMGVAATQQSALVKNAIGRTKLGQAVLANKLGQEGVELGVDVGQNLAYNYGSGLRGGELARQTVLDTAVEKAVGEGLGLAVKGIGKLVDGVGKAKSANPNAPVFKSTQGDSMDTETKSYVFNQVSDRSGMNIEQKSLPKVGGVTQAGNYNPETKTATINSKTWNDSYTTLKHELTHHLQTSNMYSELSDFIFKGMADNGFDIEALRAAKAAQYAEALGRKVDPFEVDQELVAEFCGEYLFNSEKSIERLARQNPNLFQRIYNWIVDTIKKIGATDEQKFLIDAQRKYERVIADVKKNPAKATNTETQHFFVRATKDEIAKAEKMLAEGKTEADIQRELKLSKNAVGDWVYETGDENAKVTRYMDNKERTLGEVLEHDELYEREPQLKNVKVKNVQLKDGTLGTFSTDAKNGDNIGFSRKLPDNERYRTTMAHEGQHGVQEYQNMPKGASVEFWENNGGGEIKKQRNLYNTSKNELEYLSEKFLSILENANVKIPDAIAESAQMGRLFDEFFDNPKGYDTLTKLAKQVKKKTNPVEAGRIKEVLKEIEEYMNVNEDAYYKRKALATNAYKNTAGEQEADEVARRFFMSDAERRNTLPNKYSKDTVFAEYPDGNKKSNVQNALKSGVVEKNNSLLETSKNLYGEKGNKYLNRKVAPQPAPKTKEKPTSSPKVQKDLGADALNKDYNMTFEEASKRMKTYQHGTPKSLPGKGDVSKGVDTVLGSTIISDEMREVIHENIDNFVKTSKPNKTTMDNVYEHFKSKGLDTVRGEFSAVLEKDAKIDEETIATGAALIEELNKQGRYEEALDVTGDLVEMLSKVGRTLQSAQIFTKMTPYGRVKTIRRNAEKMEKLFGKKIVLDEKKLERLFKETDEGKLDSIKREIMLDMWNQVPSTLMNKLDAIRYTAMLSSPKTHMRNIFGNSFMAVGKGISDAIEAGLEETVFKGKMEKMGAMRNKAFLNPLSKADNELKKEAGELFESIKGTILNQDVKYFDKGSMSRPLDARVFTGKNPISKLAEGTRKTVSGTLEFEDEKFMKLNFKSAFAQICKANGLTMQDLNARELRAFTDYAVQQAQQATFRDANKLAEAFNKLYRQTEIKPKDTLGAKAAKTAGKITMDAVLPFKKTPANVLKQGYRYSPMGVLHGLGKIALAKDGKTLLEGIDMLSNGLVGTPILIAGAYLADKGLVNGSLGLYSDKKTKYDQMTGKQDYSVTIDGKTITLDWVSPFSMPFFVGVELADSLKEKGLSGYALVDAMAGITNPFFEMSMLSGLETLMTSNYEENAVQTLVQNTAKGYITQFAPSVLAQIAKTIAPTETTTGVKGVGGADTSSGKFVASTLATLKSKTPGLYSKNQENVDLWGRTNSKESSMDYVQVGFRNIISPANIKDIEVTNVDKELLRLYDALGEEEGKAVIPNVANNNSNKLTYEDKKYPMSAEDFTAYKKDVGQYRYKKLQKLFKTDKYRSANNAGKAEMIADVYSAANAYTKKQQLVYRSKTFTETEWDFNAMDERRQAKFDANKTSKATFVEYYKGLDANGNGSVTQEEARKKLNSMGLSEAEAQYLWSITNSKWKAKY